MTPGQTAVFSVLWVSVVVLGGLVLVLYREVERAYSAIPGRQSGGLLPGVPLPDLEVVEDAQVRLLPDLRSSEMLVLLFVKESCSRCESLLKSLRASPVAPRTALVVLKGQTPALRQSLQPHIEVYEPAFPIEATRDFGVTSVPLAYVAQEGRVLAVGAPSDSDDLLPLLQTAAEHGSSDVTVVSVDSIEGIRSGSTGD